MQSTFTYDCTPHCVPHHLFPPSRSTGKQNGNFSFSQPFTVNNQILGYSYDAAGNEVQDRLGNTYTYDGLGRETASNGVQYVYDAMGLRVHKTGGSYPSQVVYFNDRPIALYNTSTSSWTDLIWAGDSILAEVAGNQAAAPTYRLVDHEGTLVATTDSSGNETGTSQLAPYGQVISSSTSDPFLYTGLPQDTENATDDALNRNFSTEQGRWLRPDPYNGSYDALNPQSFNRYMYVNGDPLGNVDPTGESLLSETCAYMPFTLIANSYFSTDSSSAFKDIGLATTYVGYAAQVAKGSCSSTMIGFGEFLGKEAVAMALTHYVSSKVRYYPFIQAGISIGCSIDYNSTACGAPELAWEVGGNLGTTVGDLLDVGYAICAAGGISNPSCDAFALYELANKIYGLLYNLFGWGPPKFKGSLLPRPGAMDGLASSSIGIPSQNLSSSDLLSNAGRSAIIPSPGIVNR